MPDLAASLACAWSGIWRSSRCRTQGSGLKLPLRRGNRLLIGGIPAQLSGVLLDMTQPTLHDLLRPRLEALLDEATMAGFARDAAVAVMIDLVSGSSFDTAPLPAEPALPDAPWPHPNEESDVAASVDVSTHIPNLLGHLRGRL